MAYTDEQIKERLTAMTAASEDPVLLSAELDLLVADYGQDLLSGAAEGWRWKAAKVAARYDFSDATSSFSRSQLHKHCLEMAAQYDRGLKSVTVAFEDDVISQAIGNLDGAP